MTLPAMAARGSAGWSGPAAGGDRGGYGMWPLTDESREKIVQRIAANLAAISFFAHATEGAQAGGGVAGAHAVRLGDEAAREHALVIEREAFLLADSLFRPPAGASPRGGAGGAVAESAVVLAYAQHASDAMIALLKAKMLAPSARAPPRALVLDLSQDGKREFVGAERAEELLQPLLRPQPNHHKVKLSTKSFKPAAAGMVATALRNTADVLRHVDMSDVIAGQPEEDALVVLAELAGALAGVSLQSLNLSNNALGEKGIRACAACLSSQRALEELYFENDGISVGAAQAIVELLPPDCAHSLRILRFHNNCTEDEGAVALAELVGRAAAAGLRDLRFSSTRVGVDGGIALANALAQGSSLERLDLRDNMFGPEGAEAFAATLRNHPNLTELYLGDTSLENEGACRVMEAVAACCPKLRVLDLAGNEITPEGAAKLVQCLESLPLLQRLTLTLNELQDEGTITLANALPTVSPNLEELDLSINEMRDEGAIAAAEAACSLPKLSSLDLNGNSISKAGVAKVKGILIKGCARGLGVLGKLDENEDGEGEDDE